ncbi:DUF1980 domain-containing protein [Bacillus suaedaesalsae]|uniref:DUF1980 domain-containing protein n=1 Tax=Bacillus suaedaesalsae TaxID=2810349 RepID=A0ABS2DD29_9BACI|nr:DUF1980 domain-containing protein [Bacillus suaedaesalsae]MBM6616349.1 DUF1980 domain-containing protein [Bacillus suaedaesalsae]
MQKDIGFHYFLRGIILIGLALFLLKIIVTGTIISYISTGMLPLIYVTSALLLSLGIIHVWQSGAKDQEKQVASAKYRSIILYGAFVSTIVVGLVFSNVTPILGGSKEEFIKQLDQMFGIEEDLPSDLHLEEE